MAIVAAHKTLILACGALAKEIVRLQKIQGAEFDLQCLPAGYHNRPGKIVPELRKLLDARAENYDRVIIGYGDCGTGGGLDRLLADYPNAERLPGAHCYAFYSGLPEFDVMMEEELGSFFLTDYLVRHFETLIIKGMGLDRYPELRDDYFKHYKRLVYISQVPTKALLDQAQAAAKRLQLAFEHRDVGYGALNSTIQTISQMEHADA